MNSDMSSVSKVPVHRMIFLSKHGNFSALYVQVVSSEQCTVCADDRSVSHPIFQQSTVRGTITELTKATIFYICDYQYEALM